MSIAADTLTAPVALRLEAGELQIWRAGKAISLCVLTT